MINNHIEIKLNADLNWFKHHLNQQLSILKLYAVCLITISMVKTVSDTTTYWWIDSFYALFIDGIQSRRRSALTFFCSIFVIQFDCTFLIKQFKLLSSNWVQIVWLKSALKFSHHIRLHLIIKILSFKSV